MSAEVMAFRETQKRVRQPITLIQPGRSGSGFGGFGQPANDPAAAADAISTGADEKD
jgi:hypothetical protein